MPELPEVETIRRTLEPHLAGQTIAGVEVLLPKMIQNQTPDDFISAITGKTIDRLKRRGKYLLLGFTDGSTLAFHLRMTGQLTLASAAEPRAKAVYLVLRFLNNRELRFHDTRKFGRVTFFKPEAIPVSLAGLGPEPLTEDFTREILAKKLAVHKAGIKKVLLDQTVIAGLGNIYTDEALFRARIAPIRPANSLSGPEIERLYSAIRQVLTEGISHRGTTKRDYVDGEGKPGGYQDRLRVYGRKGQPCFCCNNPISRIEFGGRGTYFCPVCQEGSASYVRNETGGKQEHEDHRSHRRHSLGKVNRRKNTEKPGYKGPKRG